jgi:hypothetical protein
MKVDGDLHLMTATELPFPNHKAASDSETVNSKASLNG